MLIKRIGVLFVVLTTLLTCFPQTGFAMMDAQKEYIYVAPDGNDSGDGSVGNPYATITAAKNRIRELKAAGVNPQKGFVVYLRGGNYELQEGVVFTEEDSGTETAPIVYRSYPGEQATLVGGASLPADKFVPIADEAIKERIVEKNARDKVLQINLKELGFENYGELYLRGAYSYRTPLKSNRPKFNPPELIVNDELLTVARYPNNESMKVQKVLKQGYPGGLKDYEDYVESFVITPGDKRIDNWLNAKEAIMHGYWYWDWADQSVFITKIDTAANSIESHQGSLYGMKEGQTFYVYNLIEEIDIPGEYYLDRESGILYMYPPEGFTSKSAVTLSLLEQDAITIRGASYIDFKGIDFTTLRAGAIIMESGHHIRVMESEIKYTADFAIEILKHTQDCGVIDCYIHDVDGGVMLYAGIAQNLTPGRGYVENCEFERFSRLTKTYRGAVNISGVENRVAYNEIHDAPHVASMIGGFDSIIEYNEVYDVLNEADDMSALYTGLTLLMRGQQVRYNYIHDLYSESSSGAGARAVYLDNSQSGVTVMGNIIENVQDEACMINGGHDNTFYNNIVINSEAGIYMQVSPDIINDPEGGVQRAIETITKSAHWDDPSAEPWKQPIFTERYPEMLAMLDNHPELPMNNKSINNVFINTQDSTFSDTSIASLLQEEGNIELRKDPGFYDMKNRNYLLKEDSSVYDAIPDFVPLPFSRMGRYDSRALYRVKDAVVLCLNSPFAYAKDADSQIDPENLKVVPKLIGDKTFVPLRFIAEALGAEVTFDAATKGIKIKGETTTLEMTIDQTAASKNGEAITLESAPTIVEDRTLVPLREISNLFDKQVFWDNSGLIAISDAEDLFNPENDGEIIRYLYDYLTIY
ncbi:MAG: right-handed parallel beta-helix repeat-containing protein [Clostridia bacterium]|nr:right-handed parallel beta-helix repeat-containing protein [Clostridia bacterium]